MYRRYRLNWHKTIPYGAIVATAMLADVFHVKEVESHCLKVEVLASPGFTHFYTYRPVWRLFARQICMEFN